MARHNLLATLPRRFWPAETVMVPSVEAYENSFELVTFKKEFVKKPGSDEKQPVTLIRSAGFFFKKMPVINAGNQQTDAEVLRAMEA